MSCSLSINEYTVFFCALYTFLSIILLTILKLFQCTLQIGQCRLLFELTIIALPQFGQKLIALLQQQRVLCLQRFRLLIGANAVLVREREGQIES